MFEASEDAIRTACGKNKRMDQLKWSTVVKKIRQKLKRELAAQRELANTTPSSSEDSDG
jgi:hypothetical protein